MWASYSLLGITQLSIPFLPVATLGTALAIFYPSVTTRLTIVGGKRAKYGAWRSTTARAWARQVTTFISSNDARLNGSADNFSLNDFQQMLVYRHIAFIHALRIFLRKQDDYGDTRDFLGDDEYRLMHEADNPPNVLLQKQGECIAWAKQQGLIDPYELVQMDQTLVEFNNIQGRCERIKNTPMPRQYNFFPKVFVFIHNTLLPFGFVAELGWVTIPMSLIVAFVFLTLDMGGEDIEDPLRIACRTRR